MDVFFLIVVNVMVPIFSLIAIGAFLHRIFAFDMGTLSKLNTFLLIPAVCFVNVYQSQMAGDTLILIIGFLVLQNSSLIVISSVVAKMAGFDNRLSATFKNSVVLSNNGNFGLPVSQLVFSQHPIGVTIQIVVLIFQNLLTFTYGLFNSVSVEKKGFQALLLFLKNPVIYALVLAIILKALSVPIPHYLWTPIENTASAFMAIALVTLGAQSAFIKLYRFSKPLILSLIGRLVLSSCIGLIVILLLNLDGTLAQALFIASAFPTSRNSSIFALEYGNYPEYAAQTVLVSTVLSMVTVTSVVYLAEIFFS
ncbi:membrane protein [Halalkalibacter wakoensis JCM 9140]|uniref:Membrane protein n=1 Tax=Halalkalibacter wakoensis JCM 9140 TaxID=1236970 RepID=W4Q762_9BACI|nr:AEC family transporter [Halalkalibacter wakoensis]GAE27800.1 membrane protein [Halalkalibacter wakoensis JCM 9140]